VKTEVLTSVYVLQCDNSDGKTDEWDEIDPIIDTDSPPKKDLILDFYLKDKMLDCMKFYVNFTTSNSKKKKQNGY